MLQHSPGSVDFSPKIHFSQKVDNVFKQNFFIKPRLPTSPCFIFSPSRVRDARFRPISSTIRNAYAHMTHATHRMCVHAISEVLLFFVCPCVLMLSCVLCASVRPVCDRASALRPCVLPMRPCVMTVRPARSSPVSCVFCVSPPPSPPSEPPPPRLLPPPLCQPAGCGHLVRQSTRAHTNMRMPLHVHEWRSSSCFATSHSWLILPSLADQAVVWSSGHSGHRRPNGR